jgi:hypothetical protein
MVQLTLTVYAVWAFQIHEVRGDMLPDDQRRVALGAHWFNLAGAFFPEPEEA